MWGMASAWKDPLSTDQRFFFVYSLVGRYTGLSDAAADRLLASAGGFGCCSMGLSGVCNDEVGRHLNPQWGFWRPKLLLYKTL